MRHSSEDTTTAAMDLDTLLRQVRELRSALDALAQELSETVDEARRTRIASRYLLSRSRESLRASKKLLKGR